MGAHGCHAEVDVRGGRADWGAALVQTVAKVHHVPDASSGRYGHTVVVRVGADGGFQAVEIAILIRAREADQGVGCGRRGRAVGDIQMQGFGSRDEVSSGNRMEE